jgi:hypothetical protein
MQTSNTRATLILAAFAALTPLARAQAPQPSTSPATGSTAGSGTATDRSRKSTMSNQVSSAVSAGFTYQPPQPAQPEVDLREVDKPKNEIIRLPEHVVLGERPAVFAERNLYSAKNLEQLAIQRYLHMQGTNRLGPRLIAMQMYQDDERLLNITTMNEKVDMYRATGDQAGAKQLQRDAQATSARRSEFSPPSSVSKVDFSELPK